MTERPAPHQHRPSTAPTGQVYQQVCEQRQLFQCFYPVLEIVKSVRFETLPTAVQLFIPIWQVHNINTSCYYYNIMVIIIIKIVNKTYEGTWLMYRGP